jgi:heat shock protein HslJ
MACPLQDEARLARAFDDALAQARGWRIDAGQLVLLDAAKAELMRLDAQPKGLAGTAWQVSGYNNGRQAVVGPIDGTALRLQFMDGGRVAGFGGCNNFSGSWKLDGNKLSLGPLAATRKACVQPEGVMAQEAAFLRALESAATARREGPRLELRTSADAMAALLTLDGAAKP